jgi:hypothetical protein
MLQNIKLFIVLETLTALGTILFWIGFFTVGVAPKNPPPGYFYFEKSFPLPDAILAAGLLAAARLLYKGHPAGRTLSLVCGGALMFLGALDFSFNYQNGMYKISAMDTTLNASMNLWTVLFGLWLAIAFRLKNKGVVI